MLELQRFLIKDKASSPKTVAVMDLDTRVQVGVARQIPAWFARWVAAFIGKQFLPITVEARETEDESLVFTIRGSAGWWHRRIEVFDADERLVGWCTCSLSSRAPNPRLYDGLGQWFAEVRGEWKKGHFAFVNPDSREVGIVTREWSGPGKEQLTSAGDYALAFHDELINQPLAKMLLLATALALGTVYDVELG
jgi:hypothetical protein